MNRCTAAVPTSTGTTPAPSVLGRAASTKTCPGDPSGAPGEGVEARRAFLEVGVAPLLGLLVHVIEKGGVPGELLDAGEPVGVGVEGGLEEADGQRAHLEDAPGPGDRLLLEALERHDLVDQTHPERLLGVVLLAEVPDLPCLLLAHHAGE